MPMAILRTKLHNLRGPVEMKMRILFFKNIQNFSDSRALNQIQDPVLPHRLWAHEAKSGHPNITGHERKYNEEV